jgi:hypothetical protein
MKEEIILALTHKICYEYKKHTLCNLWTQMLWKGHTLVTNPNQKPYFEFITINFTLKMISHHNI